LRCLLGGSLALPLFGLLAFGLLTYDSASRERFWIRE
jgi:hypothetical protein